MPLARIEREMSVWADWIPKAERGRDIIANGDFYIWLPKFISQLGQW